MDEPGPTLTPELFARLEEAILGQSPNLSRTQVLEQAGVPLERAHALWLSLGFSPPVDDDEVMFTDDDVDALATLNALVDVGVVDPRTEQAITRSMGRAFARLAEWEVAELAGHALATMEELDEAAIEVFVGQLLPEVEQLQNYVWRRHLASAAGRLLLQASAAAAPMAVGFVDIVGFTRQSRSLDAEELGAMVETFEHTVTGVVADHGGRVIKTIGDEALFATDDPVEAGRIALLLATAHGDDPAFPQVRVGLAHGAVLRRLGDVFGEVVNVASRLTSLARPGKVLLDRSMAEALKPLDEEFRVRRARTTAVKGYTRFDMWALKPPKVPKGDSA